MELSSSPFNWEGWEDVLGNSRARGLGLIGVTGEMEGDWSVEGVEIEVRLDWEMEGLKLEVEFGGSIEGVKVESDINFW